MKKLGVYVGAPHRMEGRKIGKDSDPRMCKTCEKVTVVTNNICVGLFERTKVGVALESTCWKCTTLRERQKRGKARESEIGFIKTMRGSSVGFMRQRLAGQHRFASAFGKAT